MDRLGRPRSDILGVHAAGLRDQRGHQDATPPGSAEALGVTFEEIDIKPAAEQMLGDLGHPYSRGEPVYDVTFENVQAGLRTDYLFRLANQRGGIVLGTGDLSELALGWCTYGVGDQMSHYAVNTGVPKTLIQHLIRWVASTDQFDADTNELLLEILDQEISPELVPVGEDERPQSTEDSDRALRPARLHAVLRAALRLPAEPDRLPRRARVVATSTRASGRRGSRRTRRTSYDLKTIKHWLEVFCERFFGFSQFKRSAIPNGPKVVAGGALSPRGEWRPRPTATPGSGSTTSPPMSPTAEVLR